MMIMESWGTVKLAATTADKYAATMYEILKRDGSSDETIKGMREAGRKSAERFSDEEFLDSFRRQCYRRRYSKVKMPILSFAFCYS